MPADSSENQPASGEYVVVARRYRPRSFTDLVGQAHVAQALKNAIDTGRVGHAYLFTGARGVGKTSTARILAKCLNCEQGPTDSPCGQCDNCQSIAAGEDVDVIEIDGASNRGVDEIRQLRSNVNIRPSRSRYKIYIIDEVHMLTREAFNALLKTLEEPPEHVKFIFCTTDPEKIPITVISRCQKFDFAGIRPDSIQGRLRQIVDAEGVEADDDALKVLARRAGGSMRDSQSLLEQLLSFGERRITTAAVHDMLGTAAEGQIAELAARLVARDAAGALAALDSAIGQGVDVGQLNEQLLGYFRDMMAAAVGAASDVALHTSEEDWPILQKAAEDFGLQTVLAAVQILDAAAVKMRHSSHDRVIAEMALIRICSLENLEQIHRLLGQLSSDSVAGPAASRPSQTRPRTPEKKTAEVAPTPVAVAEPPQSDVRSTSVTETAPPSGEPTVTVAANKIELNNRNIKQFWLRAANEIGGLTVSYASRCTRLAISGPNSLEIMIPATYTSTVAFFEEPRNRTEIEQKITELTGQTVKVEVKLDKSEQPPQQTQAAAPRIPKSQLTRQATQNEAVRRVMEKFNAAVDDVTPASGS